MAEGFKILDAYVEVRADASKVGTDAADQIRRQSGSMSSAGGGLGSSLMGGMQGVIGGLVGGVVSAFATPLVQGMNQAIGTVISTVKEAAIDYNSALENANIGFTTMLGSGQKAKAFLDDLQKFAASTPFDFGGLVKSSQTMLGMGIAAKDIIPDLTALGDSVASTGGNADVLNNTILAFSQMAAKGTLDMGNMNQLLQGGVPKALTILADKFHVSTGTMVSMISSGKVLAKDALPALVKGLEHGTKGSAALGGMMDKQSKTMSGSMSNIKDSINQTLSGAFLPLFHVVEQGAGKLATFASSKSVQTWAKNTSKDLKGFFKDVEKGFKQIKADPEVQKSLKEFGTAFKQAMKDAGPELKKILPDLIKFVKDALPGMITGLTQIVKAAPDVAKDLALIAGQLGNAGKSFGETSAAVGTFIRGLFGFLNDLDHWVADATHKWFKFRDDTMKVFNELPAKIAATGAMVVTGFIGGVQDNWNKVTSTIHGLAMKLPKVVRDVLGIKSPSKVFHDIGINVGKGLQTGLLGSVDDIKAAGKAMADAVEKSAVPAIEKVTKKLETLSARRARVTTALGTAKDKLSGLRDEKASYKQGVRDSIMGGADITGLFEAGTSTTTSSTAASGSLDGRAYQASYTSSTTTTTPGGLTGVRAKLRQMVSDTKAFTANIKKLVGMGLDHFSVQELIQAGPTASLPITTELLADKAGFNDLVSLQRQLNTASTTLGEYGAGYTYNDDISSAKATVSKLSARESHITAVMIVEANKIDEVHKVVKAVNALAKTAKAKKAVKK